MSADADKNIDLQLLLADVRDRRMYEELNDMAHKRGIEPSRCAILAMRKALGMDHIDEMEGRQSYE